MSVFLPLSSTGFLSFGFISVSNLHFAFHLRTSCTWHSGSTEFLHAYLLAVVCVHKQNTCLTKQVDKKKKIIIIFMINNNKLSSMLYRTE